MVFVEGGNYKISKKESVAVKSFYIGKYEVTRDLWIEVMGKDIDYDRNSPEELEPDWVKAIYKRMDLPADIHYEKPKEFIALLNQLTDKKFRLPTELEWEYAASGGNQSKGYKYSGGNNPNNVAWYRKNSSYHWSDSNSGWSGKYLFLRPVGQKSPNELGIYDMSGNLDELCENGVYKGGNYWHDDKKVLLIKSRNSSIHSGIRLVLDAE